jgi:hypothetical protein
MMAARKKAQCMALDPFLETRLDRVAQRQRRLRSWSVVAGNWAVWACLGLLLAWLERKSGWTSALMLPLVALLATITGLVLLNRFRKKTPDDTRQLAFRIESHFPDLDGRLITAVQQQPQPGGAFNFLQERIIGEALAHDQKRNWSVIVPLSRIKLAQMGHWLSLILFVGVLWQLRVTGGHQLLARIPGSSSGITVTPGDIVLERGSSLVVLARFGGPLPAAVELMIHQDTELPKSMPLAKSLADPMFGGSISEVSSNFVYHIEYGGNRTRDFKVTVFDYPRLERADADLTYPEYTRQPAKRVENTKRLSAVEGSRLDLTLQLNKPVISACLLANDKTTSVVLLHVETNRAAATLKNFPLETSKTYQLQMVDADGRTNKAPAQFVFDVQKNRTPELRLTFPRGDARPSPLEEIAFEGTVWDDFGIEAYGLGYSVGGQEPKILQLGQEVPGKEKKSFQQMLRLEDLGVQPDQLVAWFVWADDFGPDGKIRRTAGDLFFGEVRPFEEVFREGQGMDGQNGQSGQQRGGQGAKLAELQKQIINATWKLKRDYGGSSTGSRTNRESSSQSQPGNRFLASAQTQETGPLPEQVPVFKIRFASPSSRIMGQRARQDRNADSTEKSLSPARNRSLSTNKPPAYRDDIVVVRDAQAQAIEQAEAALERQEDPRTRTLWLAALKEMKSALARLNDSTNSPVSLAEALTAQQAAFQAFLRLEQHEYQVVRNRNQSQGSGGAREQQMQRQLEQMDMTQSENRYETQRQAQPPQNNERRETLQVMNRLQELARRQQDLNDRLKELQTALQEARTEQEREEIKRRLKRLQEEEQQMLADVDELRQRMDRPENQSRMNEERRQLDQTRNDVQRAADAASQGSASQALASGSRAQQQLQQMREQMRKENSSQFAEDARQLRSEARELASAQEEILKKMEQDPNQQRKSLSDSPDRQGLADQLERQKQRMTNIVERATQVSQQAEEAEPLLSRQLYDTVRKFSQDNGKNFKETQEELINRGLLNPSLYERLKQSSDSEGSKLLDLSSEMLRQNFMPQAREAGERARAGMDNLRRGVERAAESVLGDDTESLRLARQELNRLTDELQKEMAQDERNNSTNRRPGAGASGESSPQGDQSKETRASRETAQNGQGEANGQENQEVAENKQPGDGKNSSRDGQSPSREGQNGQQQAQASGTGGGQGNQSADPANPPQNERSVTSPSGRNQARQGNSDNRQRGSAGGEGGGAGGNYSNDWDRLLTDAGRQQAGPITGDGFGPWSDRLRDIEDMVDLPELRNDVARARERAQVLRQAFKRDLTKPDWAVVRLQVMKPLVQVQERIGEELLRRESNDSLVPIDRDPVPNRYSDLVRRYYEELGKDATK